MLSNDEFFDLIRQKHEAVKRGDQEEAWRISQMIPMNPDVAKCCIQFFGAKQIIDAGFNLSKLYESMNLRVL